MRLFLYILAWAAINVPLCALYGFLEFDPGIAFMLGMVHGSASQIWLFGKYTRAW